MLPNAVVVAPPVIEPQAPETNVFALISQVAQEYRIPSTTLYNMVDSESEFDPNAVGDGGKSCGLVQIHTSFWDVSCEKAKDPEFALRFAAEKIEEEKEYLWTSCNCYSLVKTRVPNVPRMADIRPNSEAQVGAVAIFYYRDNKSGKWVKHVAYVTKVGEDSFEIFEANFEACKVGKRIIHFDDSRLEGFWHSDPV